MSTGGSLGAGIGSMIGGAIGGYIGGYPGAMIGSMIGGFLGGLIDPPESNKPKFHGDLTFNTWVRDAPLGVCYGQDKCPGGVIAKGAVSTDVDQDGGGKGAPKTYTVKLNARWAVAHCEGPVALANPERKWADDKIISGSSSHGSYVSFITYLGEENPAGDSYFEDVYAGSQYPFPKLKYVCWSKVHLHVEGSATASAPNIAVELRGFLTETDEFDANPVRVAYDWLVNSRYAMGIDTIQINGDPDTVGSPWKTAADYCDELVSYVDHEGNTQQEPRFRYSRWIGQREKGFDTLVDIMNSCRGFLRYKQGKLEPIIENPNEEPEYYYSERTSVNFTTGSGCTVNRIYADFSSYPDQFWKGASGTYITGDGEYLEFYVYNQTSTYVDLVDDIIIAFPPGVELTFLKDNIKEGSFTFTMIPGYSVPNIYRVEFVNRTVWNAETSAWENEYQNDVVEHETPEWYANYNVTNLANYRKIKTIKLAGIKRKSQAMRMAQYFSDATTYARLTCSFITGVEGYHQAVGDIVGISHIQPGWDKKWFRVVSVEEKEEDEIHIGCLEYNPKVYSDAIVQVFQTNYNTNPSVWTDPLQTERFRAVQDLTNNQIWLRFKRPDAEPYWYAVQVFVQKGAGADFEYVDLLSITTPSVKLSSGITDIATTIPFDSSTLYGSFPTSGAFWISDEYITYTGISGDTFTGCTRDPLYRVAHTSDEYCDLKQVDTPYITFEDTDVGNEWVIKVVTYTATGNVADIDLAPSVTLTLV